MTSPLFSPIHLGHIDLPSRIVMAPLTRSRAAPGNVPSDLAIEYYRQRASAGLIITEATQISPQGQGYAWTPGIHDEAQIAGWSRVTQAIHEAGGRVVMQLWHVGRVSHPVFQPGGARPVAPTTMPVPAQAFVPGPDGKGTFTDIPEPQELTVAGIQLIVADYAQAARNAIAAGVDGVEVHAANGYLLDQFLNSASNWRTDRYGGSVENRARLLFEVIDAVTEAVGADRVGVRLSPMGKSFGMDDPDPEALFAHVVRELDRRGLAYLHLVEPTVRGREVVREADTRSEALMHAIRTAFSGPIILAGGYNRARADKALAEGRGDLIAFGRPFIANPDLPARLALDAPLNEPDPTTFYGGDAHGYIDYPTLADAPTDEVVS
ncbi:glycerol trinitrate reductase [Novosphingobium nitrogenifigens DSM 19370]|uniref:Glycerol trinitrate reductase n=1 Tax=Novosphingobium nitrogenifigens DSM 19370 TaxID=983920 RepID=F1Z7G2_9SPHN|nr:alkene reductase [Novosphingobium nitrogenifigens]EGD59474.1 glycerol trinitrate reductase [Novosphingobium nitrogenifigens DSM 19370]